MFKIKSDVLKKMVSEVCAAFKHSKVDAKSIKVEVRKDSSKLKISVDGKNVYFDKMTLVSECEDMVFYTTPHELQLKVGTLPEEVYIKVVANPKGHYQLRWGRDNGILLLSCEGEQTASLLTEVKPCHSISMKGSQWNFFTRNIMPFSSIHSDQIAKTHPITAGIHFEKKDQLVNVQATNGLRAIKGAFELDWFDKSSTIPANLMNTVSSLISSSDILTISTDEQQNFLQIESESMTVISKMLEGDFITTDHLYTDEKAEIVWRADRMELIEVARRIKRLDSFKPVVTMLSKDSKTFATFVGVLVEQIGAVVESETKGRFALNAFSLEAALSVLRCEEVLITAAGEGKPVTFSNGDVAEADEKSKEDVVVMLSQI